MEKICAVYQIINTETGDRYVGSSKNVIQRWREHRCRLKWKKYPNNSMYQDMQKFGIDKFRFQILAPVMPEHLKQVEQEFIEMLHPTYNVRKANGWDVERYRKCLKDYYSKRCLYNGETLTLCALRERFKRAGIKHPTEEAKMYLSPSNK